MAPRRAFVTGGAGGIGAAICRHLADAGAVVTVADLDLEAARQVASSIPGAASVEIDVASPGSVTRAVDASVDANGPIDIAVSCAGWDRFVMFLETDPDLQQKILDINLAGPMHLTRAVLPGMHERGWGRLVYISSDAGRVGSTLEAIYSGAKGGVIAFAKSIARESAKHGVTSNAVCPGPADTNLFRSMADEGETGAKIMNSLHRAIPIGRLADPEDIAPAVAFLASDAAAFITGQTLSVSGGLTMS